MKSTITGLIALLCCAHVNAQTQERTNRQLDSTYIEEVQNVLEPDKVLHAEPLYIDLIRDLGARKGEAEWNVAFEMTDRLNYDRYLMLIEYEWAPTDRLGLELEIPLTVYSASLNNGSLPPSNRVESIKAALQWSFLVRQDLALSMAVGYINEFELADLNKLSSGPIFIGNIFNPFFVIAKRWGKNFHTLLYSGPRTALHYDDGSIETSFDANLSFHYMLAGTRNFVGLETNSRFLHSDFVATLRPQMRLGITDYVLIGLGVSIPVSRENERLGVFMRMIWEPD